MTTVSQFDIQIQKNAENFVDKMTNPEEFDGSMLLTMKILLSYYEKKMVFQFIQLIDFDRLINITSTMPIILNLNK